MDPAEPIPTFSKVTREVIHTAGEMARIFVSGKRRLKCLLNNIEKELILEVSSSQGYKNKKQKKTFSYLTTLSLKPLRVFHRQQFRRKLGIDSQEVQFRHPPSRFVQPPCACYDLRLLLTGQNTHFLK